MIEALIIYLHLEINNIICTLFELPFTFLIFLYNIINHYLLLLLFEGFQLLRVFYFYFNYNNSLINPSNNMGDHHLYGAIIRAERTTCHQIRWWSLLRINIVSRRRAGCEEVNDMSRRLTSDKASRLKNLTSFLTSLPFREEQRRKQEMVRRKPRE